MELHGVEMEPNEKPASRAEDPGVVGVRWRERSTKRKVSIPTAGRGGLGWDTTGMETVSPNVARVGMCLGQRAEMPPRHLHKV